MTLEQLIEDTITELKTSSNPLICSVEMSALVWIIDREYRASCTARIDGGIGLSLKLEAWG